MLLTTTNTLEGKKIKEYKGLISSDVIYGAHIGRDILANLRDTFGGRSRSYENVLIDAKKAALAELEEKAHVLGANGVIAVDFDFEAIGIKGSMLMVNATGTAVVIE